MELLLDKDSLIFEPIQLLDDRFLTNIYRDVEKFSNQYLNQTYDDNSLVILLVLDKRQNFKIKKLYNRFIKAKYYVITAPELEMLMIHASGLFNKFQKYKATMKPCEFLANEWKKKLSVIKSEQFISSFFQKHDLIKTIKIHKSKSKKFQSSDELFLADLLK